MISQNTSILVSTQVPEFVREEHPKFITFLEAYYEFLDNTQKNQANKIQNISDVDQTLDEFEDYFFKSFLPYFPKDTLANKDLIIKNVMPLYLSKGSPKSYQLLFRMLFGESLEVSYPRDNILRASDGRWEQENILRVGMTVNSSYTANGNTTVYYVPESYDSNEFEVYVNSTLVTNYKYQKEYNKITFNSAPANNSTVLINYLDFTFEKLLNRQVRGNSSRASVIVERVSRSRVSGSDYYELFAHQKTLVGNFRTGESLSTDVFYETNLIPITLTTYSDLQSITITDGGSSYNIGDPVIIRGTAARDAVAIITDVNSGVIEDLELQKGGSGFRVNNSVIATEYDPSFFDAKVITVATTGINSLNVVTFNTDLISAYLNTSIGATDYGFPASNVPSENLSTVIASALSTNTINNLGTITSVEINVSTISSTTNLSIDVLPEIVANSTYLRDLGIIGKINILSAGTNYNVGEYLIFTNTSESSPGYGANAQIRSVDGSGRITDIKINSGGLNYESSDFPIITINTASGTGASLNVDSILGDGDRIVAVTSNVPAGFIREIKILDVGESYANTPGIDLTQYGDGNATAYANLKPVYSIVAGRWRTSDGQLSSEQNVLQGRDYFIDYSYVTSSQVEFRKYKNILKNLLHPAGLVNYAKYTIDETINSNVTVAGSSANSTSLTGTINVSNSSVVVTGLNTSFNLISLGTTYSVNVANLPSNILLAVASQEPHNTLLKENISGRILADITASNTVTSADSTAMQEYVNGTLSNTSQILYIAQTFLPTLLANTTKYSIYLIASSNVSIQVNNEIRKITTITSNTSLNVDSAFSQSNTNVTFRII
jgi:hypothetical protein